MAAVHALAHAIASAFLDGPWVPREMARRATYAVRGVRTETRVGLHLVIPHEAVRTRTWLPALARATAMRFPEPPHTSLDALAVWIGDQDSLARHAHSTVVRAIALPAPAMSIVRGALADLGVPSITTLPELAAQIGTSVPALDFLSRARPREIVRPQHRTTLLRKQSGGLRVLEIPSPPLARAQRAILDAVLARVPIHDAAHGFVRGRSPRSAAVRHTHREVVVRLDLADFFLSITAARVRGVFSRIGYPDVIAARLTRLATTATRPDVIASLRTHVDHASTHTLAQRLRTPHLPQGAPSSPALANLVAYHLDARLAGLARRFGATYTRYADDLTFSGDALSLAPRARPRASGDRDLPRRVVRRPTRQDARASSSSTTRRARRRRQRSTQPRARSLRPSPRRAPPRRA